MLAKVLAARARLAQSSQRRVSSNGFTKRSPNAQLGLAGISQMDQ